jgi:hypothetical protein
MAKIHLLAYALVEGVYQTCATYLQWASLVHQATWEMDLPDHPYEKPDDEIFEIVGQIYFFIFIMIRSTHVRDRW